MQKHMSPKGCTLHSKGELGSYGTADTKKYLCHQTTQTLSTSTLAPNREGSSASSQLQLWYS
jgi:hypothetical protein